MEQSSDFSVLCPHHSGSAGPRAVLYTSTCDTCPDKTPRTNYGMMRRISVCSICGKYLDDWQRSTREQETQTHFRPALDLWYSDTPARNINSRKIFYFSLCVVKLKYSNLSCIGQYLELIGRFYSHLNTMTCFDLGKFMDWKFMILAGKILA